jgi:hypothetical protein
MGPDFLSAKNSLFAGEYEHEDVTAMPDFCVSLPCPGNEKETHHFKVMRYDV